MYNFSSVGEERQWLRDVLLSSDSETNSEDETLEDKEMRIRRLLKERKHHNKYVKKYLKNQVWFPVVL